MKERKGMQALFIFMVLMLLSMVFVSAVSAEDIDWKYPELEIDDSLDPIVIQNEISPMKGASLHQIPVDSVIYHSPDGITRVFTQDGKQIFSAVDADAKKVAVPSAGLLPVTHVHQVPNGADIYTKESITKVYSDGMGILTIINDQKDSKKESAVPSYNGWIESSYDWYVDEIAQFIAYWDVPSSPTAQTFSLIYLFNAIQPSNGQAIIQPVLEWNRHPPRDWTGAAWYVTPEEGVFSEPIDVDVGDTIKGTMGWNPGNNKWSIIFKDEDTGISTMNVTGCMGYQDVAVFTSLEGYGVDDDSEVPGDTTFYDMRFKDLNFQNVDIEWLPDVNQTTPLTGLRVEIPDGIDTWVKLHTAN